MRLEEKLTALRREHKMTQAELAEALDVSRQAVSKWERGIASPSMENLVCMGRLFGVPVEQLVDESLALQKKPVEMAAVAEETGSAFLAGYVKIQIDAANLRSLVRTVRMGKGGEFLKTVLLEGGDIGADAVAAAGNSGALQELYGPTSLQAAAEAGAEALRGGPLTAFEKLCDDAVGEYLAGAQFVPFGEAPLLGYLAARETEYTNIRILLMGRGAGLPAGVIRSRLRNGYV